MRFARGGPKRGETAEPAAHSGGSEQGWSPGGVNGRSFYLKCGA